MSTSIHKENEALRYHRQKRGWSQQKVADLIDTSEDMVGRWERGITKPSPFYQEKLCNLFEVDAEKLGFLERTASHSIPFGDVDSGQKDALPPSRFLSMKPEELIKRYAMEQENLLRLKAPDIDWTLPQVVVFDNSQTRLPLSAISVQVDREHLLYSIPPKIEGKAQDILEEIEHYFHDSATIRLNSIELFEQGIILIVSKAHYLQYIATNYAMDALLSEKGWTRSLRDTVHPAPQLCALEESLLANHIGVGTLVFTIDNYLVIPIRSKENVGIWHQLIMPSISGATSYDDDMFSLNTAPIATWIREGREELGIDNSDFMEENDTFLGITRELLRGGKPEIFFATQLNITRAKLEQKFKKARDKWESFKLTWLEFTNPLTPPTTEQERSVFHHEFLQLLELYQGKLAPPMQANLALWYKYMCHA